MEQQIRGYAERRREEAGEVPFVMDQEARDRLFEEVSHNYPRLTQATRIEPLETRPVWLRFLLQRLAVIVPLLAAVVVVAVLLVNRQEERRQLALGESPPPVTASDDAEVAALEREVPPPLAEKGEAVEVMDAPAGRAEGRMAEAGTSASARPAAPSGESAMPALSEAAKLAAEPMPEATPDASAMPKSQTRSSARFESAEASPAVPGTGQMERAARADSQHPAETAQNEAPAPGQQFLQVQQANQYRRNFNSPPPPPVMQSFELQQSGESIALIDADGSTYNGRLDFPAELRDSPIAEAFRQQRAGTQETQVVNAPVSFEAGGMNRSLRQQVVIRGELVPLTNGVSVLSGQLPLNQLRVRGRARIESMEVPFDAVPTER